MSALDDAIKTLKVAGLLDRVQVVRAGDFEVHLGPPVAPEIGHLGSMSREEEEREYQEKLYGASQGAIPGAQQ